MDEETQNYFEQLGNAWSQAIVSNDAESIASFMADDWIIVGETGITEKDSFLALVRSGDLTHGAMEGKIERVRIHGDIAIVIAHGTNSGHYKGEPFSSDEWITDVFVKRNGQWLCVLTHLTPSKR